MNEKKNQTWAVCVCVCVCVCIKILCFFKIKKKCVFMYLHVYKESHSSYWLVMMFTVGN